MKKKSFKSIQELAWNVPEEIYRKSEALSYSTLSKYNREGFKKIPSLFHHEDSPALRVGSLVDSLLTSPEEIPDKYYFSSSKRPSETIAKMVEYLWKDFKDKYLELSKIPEEELVKVLDFFNYYSNYGYPKRILLLVKGGGDYYKFLSESEGKIIIDVEEYDLAKQNAETLKAHPYTNRYFIVNRFKPELENIDQLKFIIPYKTTGIRCMFDKLLVNHKKKTITPCDIKTTGFDENEFEKSFLNWGYYIQATLYTYILQKTIEMDEYFKDFKILHYEFIIINKYTNTPLVWKFELNNWDGDFEDTEGNVYKGWKTLYNELTYYLNKAEYNYSKEALENDGVLNISKLKVRKDK